MNMLSSITDDRSALRPPHRVNESEFFLPLAIVGGLTLLVVVLGTHFAVRSFDRASAIREQALTQNGIMQRIDEVAAHVVPQIMWDDATAHLDNRFDAKWAEENLAKYLNQTTGITQAFIVDSSDQVVFASRDGTMRDNGDYRPVQPLVAPLIGTVRRIEAARGPVRRSPTGGMVSRAIQASTLDLVDGKLAILTASLVEPDFGKALPLGTRSPIVLTEKPLDREFLQVFADRYMLDGLHVRGLGQAPRPEDIDVPARNARGLVVGYFAWRPLSPGYTMLREFLPALGGVLLILGMLAAIQLRKIHVAARTLLDRQDWFAPELSDLDRWPPKSPSAD